jgi:hypothetical protein
MKIEFYDLENKTTLRHSSDFSLQEIPRAGEHVFLPADFEGKTGGGTYEVVNTRYLYWADPRDSNGKKVQLAGIVVYLNRITEGLGEPIPID